MPNNITGVYTIQNTVSGKIYVGSAKMFNRRRAQHRSALRGGYHQNKHLQASWNKHGEKAFVFRLILICKPEHMRQYEQLVIDNFYPEYNQSPSAFSGIPAGGACTDAHKAKIAQASRKFWEDPESRARNIKAIQESMTPEECAARSERTKALWADPIYRANAIAARKGNAYSVGHKCTPAQVDNRKRAARISNMKRNYGEEWKQEYVRRYPEFAGDVGA